MLDTILIVDDEDGVRRTFQDWLNSAGGGLRVFAAADAEAALLIANETPIDLAVLDWNLGSGSDGLKLLEDLVEFQPDIVAILVTGFANQATPLDALRMGVRDYLDKNHDLTRETFLAAVHRQLDRIAPAKRQRQLNRTLAAFREAVEKVLPLVRGAAAFHDPVPLPAAIHALFRFLLRSTGAIDGALIVRHLPSDGPETTAVYDSTGKLLPTVAVPFNRTLAASVISHQDPCLMNDFSTQPRDAVELFPFEQHRRSILAAPLPVGSGSHVVLELFDKPAFTEDDRQLVAAAAEIGAELLKQALAERQSHRLLFDAVESALKATESMQTLATSPLIPAPTQAAMERLRVGLATDANSMAEAEISLRIVEAARALAVRHGPAAVDHCVKMIENLHQLLDSVGG
jgi:ActR/RegA family two-component response regulator